MIEFQRKILGDTVRNDALAAALKRTVKPGSVVVDIGSGTGYLSFLASKLGAKECILYEASPGLLALSKRLAKQNGIRNCRFIHAYSRDVKNPVRGDVVISETLGNYALEEHLIENMEDAKRFLKPKGTLIPQKLTQYVVPVVSGRLRSDIDIWRQINRDLDFEEARAIGLQNMYVKTMKPTELLGKEGLVWDTMDFTKAEKSQRRGSVSWDIEKSHVIEGFCLYWDCELVKGISLSTSPWSKPTHWEQIYLPLLEPLQVRAGDTVQLTLASDTRHTVGVQLVWEASVRSQGKVRTTQRLDMKNGYLG